VRTVLAGVAGSLFSDAASAGVRGDEALAMLLTVVAAFVAFWVVSGALLEAAARHAEHKKAERARARARDYAAANKALVRSVCSWKARAIRWQAEADLAEAEAHTAMLHTPLGDTLAEVLAAPDTQERYQ